MNSFDKITKKLGFGCMRLPRGEDKRPDFDKFTELVDYFMENGFNYFDTAHSYHNGDSEIALRECLVKRYPRESFVLTNKLSTFFFEKEEEIRPLFESQLEACGVDYFDFYLMHAQGRELYDKYKRCRAYETALELMREGKFRHFGISFHDKAEVLREILTDYPEIEVVQIQLNYADYDDPSVDAKRCYEVCREFGKPIIVMEPVKGGNLVNLPDEAEAVFRALGDASTASYAIRYAAGFEGVFMVLSGMGSLDMVRDNVGYMKDFLPLGKTELDAIDRVKDIFSKMELIACTACRYCIDGCPQNILIPDIFACMNKKKLWKNWNIDYYYGLSTRDHGRAGDCIGCAACEAVCPQHLNIRELLAAASVEFDKKEDK